MPEGCKQVTIATGRWAAALGLLVLAIGVGACASDDAPVDDEAVSEPQRPERARFDTLRTEGFDVEKADLNGDDASDQWSYFDEEGSLLRVERDLNFDGNVDMWQYYGPDGEVIEEEMDLDAGEEQVDVVAFYEEGRLVRKIMGIQFDGSFTIEAFYGRGEQLLRVERDSSGDGEADVWEYYQDGERRRVGWDTTGDGQPDRFEQQ